MKETEPGIEPGLTNKKTKHYGKIHPSVLDGMIYFPPYTNPIEIVFSFSIYMFDRYVQNIYDTNGEWK